MTERIVLSPPLAPQESTSAFSPFRLRRKAVLEETQTQDIEVLDLGPVSMPSPFLAVLPWAPMPGRSLTSLPLRC